MNIKQTLENIINSAKKTAARAAGIAILSASLIGSGCSMYMPIKDDNNYAGVGIRAALDLVDTNPNLSKEMRTVPVHDDDGGAAMGGVTLDIADFQMLPVFDLEGIFGDEDFSWRIGAEYRINCTPDEYNFDAGGLHSRELQPLPSPYESYGFGCFDLSSHTFKPYVGFDWLIEEYLILGFDVGLPYTGFDWKKGHYRFNSYEIIEKASWKGYGKSLNLRIGWKFDGSMYDIEHPCAGSISLAYGMEIYDTKFGKDENDVVLQTLTVILSYPF